MPVKYARKRTYKKKALGTRRRVSKKATTVKAIRKIVKSTVKGLAENKKATPLAQTLAISTPAAAGPPIYMQYTVVGPNVIDGIDGNIAQGVGSSDRTGNQIRPVSILNRGWLIPLNSTSGTNKITTLPMMVRMIWYRYKDNLFPTDFVVGATTFNPASNFFQLGNTTHGPSNTYIDILHKVNTDIITVYKQKVFKVGVANQQAIAGSNNLQANNDYKLCNQFKMNLGKHCKKFVYNDVGQNNTKDAIHCMIVFCNYDNSALTLNTNFFQLFTDTEMDYEDL